MECSWERYRKAYHDRCHRVIRFLGQARIKVDPQIFREPSRNDLELDTPKNAKIKKPGIGKSCRFSAHQTVKFNQTNLFKIPPLILVFLADNN